MAASTPALAERLKDVEVAASVIMTSKARALAAAGHTVISLAVGEPDFDTPPHAIEAAHAAALGGDTHYPPQAGTPALQAAVQRKFRRDNGIDYALDEIMVANGGKQIIMNAFLATIDAGDEVVIPAPYWISYADQAKLAGGTPVFVPCPQNNGFKLRPEDLDSAITPRTKWLVLNSPNNPSGAALSADEIAGIGAVLRKHPHVWVLSDDMYEHMVYGGFAFATLAQVCPDLKDRVLTVNGASKTYAMTGWRVGFCGGPRHLVKAMVNMQGQLTSGICTVAQAATVAALDGPQDIVHERAAIYLDRRDLVVAELNKAKGVVCHRPEGAFYVYPNIAGCLGKTSAGGRRIETDLDFVLALLEEQHVAAVHGAAYGMSPYFRVSYATGTEQLRAACGRIQAFCAALA